MKKNILLISLCFCMTLFAQAQTVCDDFNIANTSVIPGWTEHQGDWTIDNNRLKTPPTAAWQFITMNGSTLADGCVTARAIYGTPSQTKFVGVVGRYVSDMSYVMLKIQDNGSSGYWDRCFITYNDNNVHDFSGNFGTDAIIQLEFSGTTLIARVDVDQNGVWDYVETVNVAATSSGLSGIGAYNNAFADDFCYSTACCDLPGAAGTITGTASVCQQQSSVAYNVPVIGNADSYTWEYSGVGAVIIGTTESIIIDFQNTATSGNLTVYAMNTCGAGTISANFPITVNPLPDAADAIIGSAVVCNETTDNQYSISVLNSTDTYVWNYSGTGVTINGASNNVTLDFSTTATSGILTVYGENTCGSGLSSVLDITVNDCTGIDELNFIHDVNVIPNPNNGQFSVAFSSVVDISLNLTVINSIGQIVYELNKFSSLDRNNINIDLSHLPSGNYSVRIFGNESSVVRNFVIQR